MADHPAAPTDSSHPFAPEALTAPESLRRALTEGGYTQERLAATLGISAPGERLDMEVVRRRVAGGDAYARLVRLFLLAQPLEEKEAAAALQPASVRMLEAAGLLLREGSRLRSAAKIVPFEDLFCLSDFGHQESAGALPPDHVLGIGPASMTTAKLAVHPSGGSVFDLGCGAGIQSLLAAREARQVIGGDTNPRALNMAAMNARLNGVTRIEWREGSFFEPVAGELFDGIVANPPFVISPRSRFLFCDSPLSGDGVSEQVIRQAAAHLKEGGFASVLFNWHYQGEEWERRPFEWCAGSGCDVWLVRSADAEPLTYAANWLSQLRGGDAAAYGAALDEWLAYYQELGITRLCSGAVVLRKRSGRTWQRADSMEIGHASGACGGHLRRIFELETLLHEEGEAGLLERRWLIHADTAMTQRLKWDGDGWALLRMNVGVEEGLPFAGDGDHALMRMLDGCRGQLRLREILESLAAELELPFHEIRASALAVFAKLVRGGILMPGGRE